MNRYPSYKPSGVKWLGEIPSHWEMRKMKFAFDERSEKGYPFLPLLAATQNHGVIRKEEYENRTVEATKSLETLKLVDVGDFVISLRSFQGGIEISYDKGIISPAYTVLRPTHITGCYFKHLGKSPIFIQLLKSMVTGIREGQNIDYGKLRENLLPIPPIEEQSAIAAYLDTATAKIDAAIAQQQKMIDLLNERKQIIINRAVTKGLNPNAKMKDSGVEWIGEIPEGWSFVRLKHLSTIISKGTTPSTIGREILSNGNIRFIKAENIVKNEVSAFPEFYIDKTTHQILKRSNLKAGDLLFVIAGATIGKVAILPDEMTPANTNQAISFIRLTNRNNVKYVWLVLQSDITKKYIWENAVQSAQPNISMEDLGNIQIPLPTNEDEQRKILSYVESQIEPIDKSINSCIKQISLLQERKQIIINEVVTGKVKVV